MGHILHFPIIRGEGSSAENNIHSARSFNFVRQLGGCCVCCSLQSGDIDFLIDQDLLILTLPDYLMHHVPWTHSYIFYLTVGA